MEALKACCNAGSIVPRRMNIMEGFLPYLRESFRMRRLIKPCILMIMYMLMTIIEKM